MNTRRPHGSHRSARTARALVAGGTAVVVVGGLGLTAWAMGWPPFDGKTVSAVVQPAVAGSSSAGSAASAGSASASSTTAAPSPTPNGSTGTATAGPTKKAAAGSSTTRGTATGRVSDRPRGGTVLVAAVGDIACDPSSSAFDGGRGSGLRCRQQAVADQVARKNPDAFLPLGDNQYDNGTLAAYRASYDKAFGRFRAITHPVVGNHEYHTANAAGYFDYFGSRAGTRGKGWYSFDLGAWHIVALNANCGNVGCKAGSEQEQWLRADLAAHPARCTLAMWHQPRWSSGSEHGDSTSTSALVQALYDHHVDVLLSGHDHDYERFAPQNPAGGLDRARGVRQFVAGAGGKSLYGVSGQTNTEARNATGFGALFLSLGPTSYTWQYANAVGGSYSDSGTTACH